MTKDEILAVIKEWAYCIGYFDIVLESILWLSEDARNNYLNILESKNFQSLDDLYDYFIN